MPSPRAGSLGKLRKPREARRKTLTKRQAPVTDSIFAASWVRYEATGYRGPPNAGTLFKAEGRGGGQDAGCGSAFGGGAAPPVGRPPSGRTGVFTVRASVASPTAPAPPGPAAGPGGASGRDGPGRNTAAGRQGFAGAWARSMRWALRATSCRGSRHGPGPGSCVRLCVPLGEGGVSAKLTGDVESGLTSKFSTKQMKTRKQRGR